MSSKNTYTNPKDVAAGYTRKAMPDGGHCCTLSDIPLARGVKEDRNYAWYLYLTRCKLNFIGEMCGQTEERLKKWFRGIIKGKYEYNAHPFPLRDHAPKQPWSKRDTLILKKLRKFNRSLSDCARILEREKETVKQAWKEIENEKR